MKQFPNISNVYLITTHRCNLACRYCFVHQDPHDMPLKVAFDAIDWLVANNPNEKKHTVFFFGGEPLLRFHDLMVPTVLYAERKYPDRAFNFSMTTNSVLMDEEVLEFIKEHNLGVLTSIDGNPECQGYNRPFHNGTSSAEIVETNVKRYLAAGRVSTFRSTIVPATCHLMYDNYIYAHDLGYRSMFALTNAYEVWPADKQREVYEQMMKIAKHYVEYFKQNGKTYISWSNIERHFREVYRDINLEKEGKERPNLFTDQKCGYGQNPYAAVAVNGDIYGCQELVSNEGKKNTFWIGNIYTGIENERRQALYDLFYSFPKTGDMACKDCAARSICNGGCSATNYVLMGDLNHCPAGHCFYFRHSYAAARYIVENLMDNETFFKRFLAPQKRTNMCQMCQQNNSQKQPTAAVTDAGQNAATNVRNTSISTTINNGPVKTAPTPLKSVTSTNSNTLTSASAIHGLNNTTPCKDRCNGNCTH